MPHVLRQRRGTLFSGIRRNMKKIPNITNDPAENDGDERLIAEPTPAGQYASVKN